jgi:hypothetical protein
MLSFTADFLLTREIAMPRGREVVLPRAMVSPRIHKTFGVDESEGG